MWHSWQRWGYDFRLPDIFPPNPSFGAPDDFRKLVETCRGSGVLFAPHDNYIDLYPDAEGFSYDNVAFLANGQPQRAWFNYGRDAQSYRARADRVPPLVKRNLRLIRDGFAPTSYFIDVWSSMAPYDYWTSDGQFVDRAVTGKVWGETFAWIREYLGGDAPQISEAGHDRLIGWLDGAQANQLRVDPQGSGFVWNIRAADAERIPWIDAAYHDRFVLHGAGYQDRYAAGLDLAAHGMYSDDYMATEMLTGRPAMVQAPFSRDVVRKYWLLHDIMRALALRRIETVEFAGGDIHRQHVRWDNGTAAVRFLCARSAAGRRRRNRHRAPGRRYRGMVAFAGRLLLQRPWRRGVPQGPPGKPVAHNGRAGQQGFRRARAVDGSRSETSGHHR
ncbi:MAG: hypothetical protein LAQ30_21120 [Acidobacteriia bacterium]|nr:hypothetical protein [Terriglobia bacterium]